MYGLFVEKHLLKDKPLSWHLARHIYSHGQDGKIAIVTDKPETLLPAVRKQWLRLIRQVQNENSGTLNSARKDILTARTLWMQSISFTCKPPDDLLEAGITFATADDFVRVRLFASAYTSPIALSERSSTCSLLGCRAIAWW